MKNLVSIVINLVSWMLSFAAVMAEPSDIHRIVFGSCANQEVEQPVWDAINADKPDIMVMLGDNIYGDSVNPAELEAKYRKLASKPGFQLMRKQSQLVAIWDDHDYGMNDSGRGYPAKKESRRLFLEFFGEKPQLSTVGQGRWDIHLLLLGKPCRRVQLLLIDTRWDRDDLKAVSQQEYEGSRVPAQMGPYRPNFDIGAHMICEAQWKWLERELQEPADVRILASGIQVLSDYSGWECWANFPEDQDRLFSLLRRHRVENLVLLSGDTHWGRNIASGS